MKQILLALIIATTGYLGAETIKSSGGGTTGSSSSSSSDATKLPLTGGTLTGQVTVVNSSITLNGSGGNILTGSSVTASAFFGNGAGLTGVTATEANTYASSKTFTVGVASLTVIGSMTVQGHGSFGPPVSGGGGASLVIKSTSTTGLHDIIGLYTSAGRGRFFVGEGDANSSRISIGTRTAVQHAMYHVQMGASGASPTIIEGSGNQHQFALESTGVGFLNIVTPNNVDAGLTFSDPQEEDRAFLRYRHTSDTMDFQVAGGVKMTILSSGNVGIGTTNPSTLFNVSAGVLTVNGGGSSLAIGTMTVSGVTAPPNGKALCLASGALGFCSDTPTNGSCTCVAP